MARMPSLKALSRPDPGGEGEIHAAPQLFVIFSVNTTPTEAKNGFKRNTIRSRRSSDNS
jgi:hypothetical protein